MAHARGRVPPGARRLFSRAPRRVRRDHGERAKRSATARAAADVDVEHPAQTLRLTLIRARVGVAPWSAPARTGAGVGRARRGGDVAHPGRTVDRLRESTSDRRRRV